MGFSNEIIDDTSSSDEYATCTGSDVETPVSHEDSTPCSDQDTTNSDEQTADSEEEEEEEEEEKETLDSNEGHSKKEARNTHERSRDSSGKNSTTLKKNEVLAEIISKLPAKSHIAFEIFAHLPIKSIFKFKCVSKGFSKLTSEQDFTARHSQRIASENPFTGFFYQNDVLPEFHFTWRRSIKDRETYCGEPKFLSIDRDASWLPDPSLKFLKQDRTNGGTIEIIDSCNGLIFCTSKNRIGIVTTCYVCNPSTKQSVALPHPRKGCTRLHYALLAESTRTGYLRYDVLCLYRPTRGDPCSKLLRLSSETGVWEEFEEILPPLCHDSLMGSKVFYNGALFWDCLEGNILVCHSKESESKRPFELIESPRAPLGRCLWKFGDKLLCYCHGFEDDFPAWSLCFDGDKPLEWKLEDSEDFENLTEGVSSGYHELQITLPKVLPRTKYRILGYNPGSRKVYLLIPENEIFSYQFAGRRLKWVWGYQKFCGYQKYNSPDRVMPFVHSLAPMLIGGVAEEKPENKVEEEMGRRSNDTMATDETVRLSTFYTDSANNVRPRKAKRRGSH